MMIIKRLLPVVMLLVLGFFLWRGLSLEPSLLPSVLLDKPAPQFVLEDLYLDKPSVSTADLRGQVSLMSVWATWCRSCRDEHQTKMMIAKNYDIPMIAINYKDDRMAAQRWLTQKGNPYKKIAFDKSGHVAIDWGVYGTPETYLIDQAGIIRYRHVGALSDSVWQKQFLPRITDLQDLN